MKKLFFFSIFVFYQIHAFSQTVTDAVVVVDSIPGNASFQSATFNLSISDTLNIAEIEITISEGNGTVVKSGTFAYDPSVLPGGFTYQRTGQRISVGLGSIPVSATYFGNARVKSATGAWSDSYSFLFN